MAILEVLTGPDSTLVKIAERIVGKPHKYVTGGSDNRTAFEVSDGEVADTQARLLSERKLQSKVKNSSSSYTNGRQKAEAYLNSRIAAAGVRLENINNNFTIRKTRSGFDVLLKGEIVYQSYNREEAERWARSNRGTPFEYDESSAPK